MATQHGQKSHKIHPNPAPNPLCAVRYSTASVERCAFLAKFGTGGSGSVTEVLWAKLLKPRHKIVPEQSCTTASSRVDASFHLKNVFPHFNSFRWPALYFLWNAIHDAGTESWMKRFKVLGHMRRQWPRLYLQVMQINEIDASSLTPNQSVKSRSTVH